MKPACWTWKATTKTGQLSLKISPSTPFPPQAQTTPVKSRISLAVTCSRPTRAIRTSRKRFVADGNEVRHRNAHNNNSAPRSRFTFHKHNNEVFGLDQAS